MTTMSVRKPAVAGRFYPSDRDELINLMHSIHLKEEKKFHHDFTAPLLIGGISPHAGYIFSGAESIHLFEAIKRHPQPFDTLIVIHPNHNGIGAEIALDEHEEWETPMGTILLDQEFMDQLDLPRDALAHKFEHSGEVMIPFIQYKIPYEVKIVPIAMSRQTPEHARMLSAKIYEANKVLQKKIFLIASSDFSHYVSPEYGHKMDQLVIDEIITMDSEGLYKAVKKNNISVCGFGPIMTLIEYARKVTKYPEAMILRRGHSGETMPSREVVDYVTMLVYSQVT
jgi:AmmeMemoRadiSam system protein B